ncbi:MAG: PEP-CTERM sorting domain-containing protein [Mariniblastus sp.]
MRLFSFDMSKAVAVLSIAVLTIAVFPGPAAKADVLLLEDFEDESRTYSVSTPEFHDGTSDYFGIIPLLGAAVPVDPYTGFGGSSFFAIEDMDDGGTRPDTGTISFAVNISTFDNLSVDFKFATGGNGATTPSYDDEESFLVRASVDGGAFQNLIAFEAVEPGGDTTNNVIRQDTDFDGIGDGFLPSSAMTTFGGLSIAGTGTILVVEVIVTSSDGNSEFAFDDFQINGISSVPEPSSAGLLGLVFLGVCLRRRR